METSTTLALICCLCMCSSLVVLVGIFLWKKFPPKKAGGGGGEGQSVGTGLAAGTSGSTNVSTFGGPGDDNDIGYIGVDLNKLGNAGLTFSGKPLIPVAVFMGHGAKFLYKILEIKATGISKPFYGLVADLCDSSQGVCKTNMSKGGRNFLVDIHRSGWPRIGLSKGESYLSSGTYKVVGELKPKDLPKSVWMPKVAANKDSMVCRCKGGCTEKEADWTTLSECT